MKLLKKLLFENPALEEEIDRIKLEAMQIGYKRGQLSKVSEKKQRRIWKKEADKLAGKDIDKFLDDYEVRYVRLQRFFWFLFACYLTVAVLVNL